MTPENQYLWNSFEHELRKVAFPQSVLAAAEKALAGGQRAAGATAQGLGRVGAEALSGIPARMNMMQVNRSKKALLRQLQGLEAMTRSARPPRQKMLQGREAYEELLDQWSRGQEQIGQRRQMLKQQLPVFESEGRRLMQHLQSLKSNPWTTDLRAQGRR
tara:strand:+ start:1057 stop:1536 length:480 start_codon:yes stop_codon:yes gene_type:complete